MTFQVIASRTDQKFDTDAAADPDTVSLFCFDLLHVEGRDLLDEPLEVRIAVMAESLPAQLIVRANCPDVSTR